MCKKVDIIVVNWNSADMTMKAVAPYFNYITSGICCNLIVVDNGSTEEFTYLFKNKVNKVISNIEILNTKTKLLAIVANERGASEAVVFDAITYLGYPFSISETFGTVARKMSSTALTIWVQEIQTPGYTTPSLRHKSCLSVSC